MVGVDKEFEDIFGRGYGGLVDTYKCEDADCMIVIRGSFAGVARDTADMLRLNGIKTGVPVALSFHPLA